MGVGEGNGELVREVPKPDRRQYSGLLLLDLGVISLIMTEESPDFYLFTSLYIVMTKCRNSEAGGACSWHCHLNV